MQLKACLKKDWMELTRTFKIFGVFAGFLAFAVIDPLTIKFIPKLMELSGIDAGSLPGVMTNPTPEMALTSFVGDAALIGLLVCMLCMLTPAGGDRKNHSSVIPICSGMSRSTYTLSKFLVFPPMAFLAAVVAYLAAYASTRIFFTDSLPFSSVLPAMAALGLYAAFAVSVLLLAGILTGKAGVCAALIIVFLMLAPSLLGAMDLNHYNPLALIRFASDFSGEELWKFWITSGGTLAICAGCYFITSAVLTRKKVI